jgi:hypothetical protein
VIAVANSPGSLDQFSYRKSADSGTASCEAEGGHFVYLLLH